MLSKMARPETNEDGERYFKLTIRNDMQSCYKKVVNWQKKLSNGRIITLQSIEDYKSANAYVYTTPKIANYLKLNNSREPSINLDDYDGNIEPTSAPIDKSITIDGINLDLYDSVNSGHFTKAEAKKYIEALLNGMLILEKNLVTLKAIQTQTTIQKITKTQLDLLW